METISSRQTDMQKFIADGCREALLEEKRRFCFLADKHCMFSYQISSFHDKVRKDRGAALHRWTPTGGLAGWFVTCCARFQAKETLAEKLPHWQDKCCDITKVPEAVMTMIDKLSSTPEQSPLVERYNRVSGPCGLPPRFVLTCVISGRHIAALILSPLLFACPLSQAYLIFVAAFSLSHHGAGI